MANVAVQTAPSRGLSERNWFPVAPSTRGVAESATTANDSVLMYETAPAAGQWIISQPFGTPPPPAWVAPVVMHLAQLPNLPEGWGGPGVPRIGPSFIESAIGLLACVMNSDTPAPSIVPTYSGGIQLEWHRGGIDLEVELLSPSRFAVTFQDAAMGQEWDVELGDAVHQLQDPLRLLAERSHPGS